MAPVSLPGLASAVALSLTMAVIPQPARSDSYADVNQLLASLQNYNTKVRVTGCTEKGVKGYYQPQTDEMVICSNALTDATPAAIWDVLAHEATHKMQNCVGGPIVKRDYFPRIMRELRAFEPESLHDLVLYPGDHYRREVEARWMALQAPSDVIAALNQACRRA